MQKEIIKDINADAFRLSVLPDSTRRSEILKFVQAKLPNTQFGRELVSQSKMKMTGIIAEYINGIGDEESLDNLLIVGKMPGS